MIRNSSNRLLSILRRFAAIAFIVGVLATWFFGFGAGWLWFKAALLIAIPAAVPSIAVAVYAALERKKAGKAAS